MKHIASVLVGVLTLILMGCQDEQGTVKKDAKKNEVDIVGWVHGSCVASSTRFAEGEEVSIVDIGIDNGNEQLIHAFLGKKNPGSEQCMPLLEDRKAINEAEDVAFFSLQNSNGELIEFDGLGIAITIDSSELGTQAIDINNNTVEDRFAYCSTGEGVKYYIWDKERGEKKPFWQGYYYLGYDTEADCQF